MIKKWLILALTLSLGFNVGFLVIKGLQHSKKPKHKMTKEFRPPREHRKMNMFKDENMREARSENKQLKREFFAELAKPDINTEKIQEIIVEIEHSQRVLEHSILHNFVQMRHEMSADEAATFFTSFQKRGQLSDKPDGEKPHKMKKHNKGDKTWKEK
jgi:hypothetical protein